MNLSLDSVLVQDKTLPTAELDGRVVVMSLGPVGRIFDRLLKLHPVDKETLTRDVTPFLQTLLEQRLIRIIAPEAMQ